MRLSLTRIAFLFSLCLIPLFPATAQDNLPDAFLNLLNSIPANSSATDSELITIFDVTAIERAYAGTERVTSWAEFEALGDASDDPEWQGRAAWWMVFLNNNSSWLSVDSFGVGDEVPATVGFDLFAIDQEAHYGQPPAEVNIIQGDFDEQAIQNAFEALGFTQSDDLLWCGAEGCDAGTMINIEARNPANPFGGQLGRSQPIIIGDNRLISSPSLAQVEASMRAADDTDVSLGDDPAYVTSLEAAHSRGVLIQAAWIDGTLLDETMFVQLTIANRMTESILEALSEDFQGWEQLPAPEVLMLADVASDSEQIGLVELVYDNQEDAETAVRLIPERIASSSSMATNRTWTEIFEDRGVAEIETFVFEQDGMFVAGIEFGTPIAGTPEQIIQVTDRNNLNPPELLAPGSLYRLLFSAFYQRDLLWLANLTP